RKNGKRISHENMKALQPLTGSLLILLRINVLFYIASLGVNIYGWSVYASLDPRGQASELTPLSLSLMEVVSGLFQIILAIILGITFLRWIYRLNKSLSVLSSVPKKFSPGWSVGWYFVPLANLFKPLEAMRETWTVVHRGAPVSGFILGVWW